MRAVNNTMEIIFSMVVGHIDFIPPDFYCNLLLS